MRSSLLTACLAFAWGCSDASLYGKGIDNTAPDRLAVGGKVCTDDAREAAFPVKVIFLVDQAAGPLFAGYDPELQRLRALNEAIGLQTGGGRFEFSVIGYGPYARRLAPSAGWFTTNPGELDSAVATLGLPQACLGGRCRDFADGLSLARATIEGDLADLNAGQRLHTQYVVVMMGAGPPNPFGGWAADTEALSALVADVREDVEDAGALSFSLHALQLAAVNQASSDPALELDRTEDMLEQLAFVGGGSFERFDVADGISLDRVGLLKLSSLLESKGLLVTNLNALPDLPESHVDSDMDGLSDDEEEGLATDPRERDTDGDGIGDLIEMLINFDPLVADSPQSCSTLATPYTDVDVDFMNECEEKLVGTDPFLVDSDGDSMPDWIEVYQRTDYVRPDHLVDSDWDGMPNGDELLAHTDPGSADANSHLADSYRYDITDLGLLEEPVVFSPRQLSGVEALAVGGDVAGGVSFISYLPGNPPTMRFQSPRDDAAGAAVAITEPGVYDLFSSSAAAGLDRWARVRVEPALLPPTIVDATMLIEISERHCLEYKVNNIRLLDTRPGPGRRGENNIFLYFAQAPQGRLGSPGLFRLAHLPVTYTPDVGRDPSDPLVEVRDEEFVTIGD